MLSIAYLLNESANALWPFSFASRIRESQYFSDLLSWFSFHFNVKRFFNKKPFYLMFSLFRKILLICFRFYSTLIFGKHCIRLYSVVKAASWLHLLIEHFVNSFVALWKWNCDQYFVPLDGKHYACQHCSFEERFSVHLYSSILSKYTIKF